MSSLQRRNVGRDAAPASFDIVVRGRPVKGKAGKIATHCYLALKGGNIIVDTLSFDPSNSIGWNDADPKNSERGEVVVARSCRMDDWSSLKRSFIDRATAQSYNLRTHNCCHAVMESLVCTNLERAGNGVAFARDANETWHDFMGTLAPEEFVKKNS
jgi:hypothetical protein